MNKNLLRIKLHAIICLILLSLLFVISYEFTNGYTYKLEHGNAIIESPWLNYLLSFFNFHTPIKIPEIIHKWEHKIPFIECMVIPYSSESFLYGISFLLVINHKQLKTLALRLLFANIIAVVIFILYPLTNTFEKPIVTNQLYNFFFTQITHMDMKYNQNPSLHIIYVCILFSHYAQYIKSKTIHVLSASWFILIAISTLTTYQHHFIDIIGGLITSCYVFYLVPNYNKKPMNNRASMKKLPYKNKKMAKIYLLLTVVLLICFFIFKNFIWCYFAFSAFMLTSAYYGLGAKVYRKDNFHITTIFVLLPLFLGYYISVLFESRKLNKYTEIDQNISVGHYPLKNNKILKDHYIVDLTAELLCSNRGELKHTNYVNFPLLDLCLLNEQDIKMIDSFIQELIKKDSNVKIFVHCAFGLSRSITVVLAYLMTKNNITAEQSIEILQQKHMKIYVKQKQLSILNKAL